MASQVNEMPSNSFHIDHDETVFSRFTTSDTNNGAIDFCSSSTGSVSELSISNLLSASPNKAMIMRKVETLKNDPQQIQHICAMMKQQYATCLTSMTTTITPYLHVQTNKQTRGPLEKIQDCASSTSTKKEEEEGNNYYYCSPSEESQGLWEAPTQQDNSADESSCSCVDFMFVSPPPATDFYRYSTLKQTATRNKKDDDAKHDGINQKDAGDEQHHGIIMCCSNCGLPKPVISHALTDKTTSTPAPAPAVTPARQVKKSSSKNGKKVKRCRGRPKGSTKKLNSPKRPSHAYNLFYMDERKIIKKQLKTNQYVEIGHPLFIPEDMINSKRRLGLKNLSILIGRRWREAKKSNPDLVKTYIKHAAKLLMEHKKKLDDLKHQQRRRHNSVVGVMVLHNDDDDDNKADGYYGMANDKMPAITAIVPV
eukprot:CAMPEP_0118688448 /NCGR_PEP_ID=MMETSP0800-20121206/8928_1 /TAXON_ID=210618 ORGANISM="Striatella unipunctata, Strain CCMP2910" /NCGR_SAMPLE_ID=MMETSP0800 /ASSEMBLY_ACC=CAM_ASM_000638 /LENGTH=423 /DNA_ID=CAMNT_0006585713 /DNA_START=380 /DNA_END=1653 /DNA_ORIENTATION=+